MDTTTSLSEKSKNIIEQIGSGKFKRIIICSGAGISTDANIPDFRYSKNKINPSTDMNVLKQYISEAKPTSSQILAKWLDDKGWLRRVYTQNVDGLYTDAGLDSNRLVEFHGNLKDDNVVYYEDPISLVNLKRLKNDHKLEFTENDYCDLLIVMGTSLKVSPFKAIPNMVNKKCVRVIVDINLDNCTETVRRYKPKGSIEEYSTFKSPSPTFKFYRKVSSKSKWYDNHSKWKEQYLLEMNCSEFSNLIMTTPKPTKC